MSHLIFRPSCESVEQAQIDTEIITCFHIHYENSNCILCSGRTIFLFISNDKGLTWEMSKTIQVGHEICAALFCYDHAPLDILIGGPLGEVTYIENGQVVNTIRKHTNGIIGFGSRLLHDFFLIWFRTVWTDNSVNGNLKITLRLKN